MQRAMQHVMQRVVVSLRQHSPAIVEAFYPGEVGGTAIMDVLRGVYNPTAKLPYTIYPEACCHVDSRCHGA